MSSITFVRLQAQRSVRTTRDSSPAAARRDLACCAGLAKAHPSGGTCSKIVARYVRRVVVVDGAQLACRTQRPRHAHHQHQASWARRRARRDPELRPAPAVMPIHGQFSDTRDFNGCLRCSTPASHAPLTSFHHAGNACHCFLARQARQAGGSLQEVAAAAARRLRANGSMDGDAEHSLVRGIS